MSEKHLLSSSGNSGIHRYNKTGHPVRIIATIVGVFVVLVGAANVSSTLLTATLGDKGAMDVFAPVALLQNKKTPPVATSTALTSHATSTPITPARLKIAAIGVDAAVVQVGKKDDGSMGTPQVFGEVGWYALGSKPGEPGNAVLDGHVNNALTTAGVFQHLNQVKLGDIITLSDTSGATLTYKVTQLQQYPADTAPDASIFAVSGPSQVVLITCDGDWVESAKSYSKRFVVFATLQ